jgi:hypothetical protein
MSIFAKPVSQLATSDVQELLEEQAVENARLEFKSKVPDKEETLKKLSSFANSFGGFMVIGARADSADGRIESLPGVDEQPGYKQKVVQWCFDAVSPPLLVEVSDAIPSPAGGGKFCYVIHTAESEVAPHFLNGRKGVWVRTDEFSQRFEPQLATENELRLLLNRRQAIQERRAEIVRRSRRRLERFVSPEAQGVGDAKRSAPAVRLEVSVGPRFPARPACTQAALVESFKNCHITWCGAPFPHISVPLASQHESILSLETHPAKMMVEANVWGMLFYGTDLPTKIILEQNTINGIHLHRFAGHLLVFAEHAKRMISCLGCVGPLSFDVTLSGIRGIPWLYADMGGICDGPKSPLDDEFSFSLPATSEELREQRDKLVLAMLQFVLFATNWSDFANRPASLESLLRSGYKFSMWKEPPAVRA